MNGYGKRALIVEHDEDERTMLSLMLANEGYIAHMAPEECLALEEMKRRRFDVVIAAHHLPHISGVRLVLIGRLVWPGTPRVCQKWPNEEGRMAALANLMISVSCWS